MAFPFSPHLIIHARLAKPCCHKKGEGGEKPWFFVSATHATLIAYWLSLLTTCWPQKQIPLAAVHLSGARERREHSENSKGNSGMGGERERGGKMFLSSLGASGEEEVLCGTSKTQQTNKEVDLFYYLLKAPWSYAIIQLRQSRAPRGLSCKGHVRNSAARFLRIFPPAPCFFLMASGVH